MSEITKEQLNEYIKRGDALSCEIHVIIPIEDKKVVEQVVQGLIDHIKSVPSADVVEVKHGKWIKAADDGVWSYSDASAECDQCHKVTFNGWGMNYCPNCGAKMDEREQEHE